MRAITLFTALLLLTFTSFAQNKEPMDFCLCRGKLGLIQVPEN
jgi:hypothetical protein